MLTSLKITGRIAHLNEVKTFEIFHAMSDLSISIYIDKIILEQILFEAPRINIMSSPDPGESITKYIQ